MLGVNYFGLRGLETWRSANGMGPGNKKSAEPRLDGR